MTTIYETTVYHFVCPECSFKSFTYFTRADAEDAAARHDEKMRFTDTHRLADKSTADSERNEG